ncbi:hypothetical protein BSKO_11739 [Bryopsis sp. KO-2023]|nr:hypothetical protein BSKO_11739 [Bryopsis sp. KO-2023]
MRLALTSAAKSTIPGSNRQNGQLIQSVCGCRSKKQQQGFSKGAAHNEAEILRTATARREYLEWLLQQEKEEQIVQSTALSVTENVLVDPPSKRDSPRGQEYPSREEEMIWENSRFKVKAETLESENDVLKDQMKKLVEHVADLESKVVFTEGRSKTHQARVHALASKKLARLEEQVGRQKNTLSEMTVAAEALAADNVAMSARVVGLEGEKSVQMQTSRALEERVAGLQELYLRNLNEATNMDNPTVHEAMQQRCLDELATQEVLDASRPPSDFPIPEAPAVAKIRPALHEIKALRQERDKLEAKVKALSEKVDSYEKDNRDLAQRNARERNTAKQSASLHQSRMLGMIRRLRYLAEQMKEKEKISEKKDGYIRRLESQLVAEHRKLLAQRRVARDRLKRDPKMKKLLHEKGGEKFVANDLSVSSSEMQQAWFKHMESALHDLNSSQSEDLDGLGSLASQTHPADSNSTHIVSTDSSKPIRDTLASIDEMEMQLRKLDEEVAAGNYFPDGRQATRTESPSQSSSQIATDTSASKKASCQTMGSTTTGIKQHKKDSTPSQPGEWQNSGSQRTVSRSSRSSLGSTNPSYAKKASSLGGAKQSRGARKKSGVSNQSRSERSDGFSGRSAKSMPESNMFNTLHWIPTKLLDSRTSDDTQNDSGVIGTQVHTCSDDAASCGTSVPRTPNTFTLPSGAAPPPNPFLVLEKLNRIPGADAGRVKDLFEKLGPVKESWAVYQSDTSGSPTYPPKVGQKHNLNRGFELTGSSEASDDFEAPRNCPPKPTPRAWI